MENRQERIQSFMIRNSDKIELSDYYYIKNRLSKLNDDQFDILEVMHLKHPLVMIFISYYFGWFGIDRILLHDYKKGIIKFLMFLMFFTIPISIIWWIYDLITTVERTKQHNYDLINNTIELAQIEE